jgi:hypothetical protein
MASIRILYGKTMTSMESIPTMQTITSMQSMPITMQRAPIASFEANSEGRKTVRRLLVKLTFGL